MTKKRMTGLHTGTIERWMVQFAGDLDLEPYFEEFRTLSETRARHAREIHALDIEYAENSMTKREYRDRKLPLDAVMKGIKPRMRKQFDTMVSHILLKGIECSCYICGLRLAGSESHNRDHVFPKVMGFGIGGNMMPAHYDCNQSKDSRFPTESEVSLAVTAYEFAGMPFHPRVGRRSIADIDQRYWEIIRQQTSFEYVHRIII
jgi:5-methylcytosine-specific restriction endonuclease McrA